MSRLAKADAWRCTSDACRIRRCDGQRWPMSIGRCLWTRRPLIGWLRFNRRADLCSGLGGGRGSRTGVLRYLPESYLSRRTPVFLFLNSSTTPHSVPPSPGFLPSQWRHKKSPRPPRSSPVRSLSLSCILFVCASYATRLLLTWHAYTADFLMGGVSAVRLTFHYADGVHC